MTGILNEYFGVNLKEPLTLDLSLLTLINEHKLDSLDMIEFTMAVEDEFNIEISDERLEKFKTIGDVVAYIKAPKPDAAKPTKLTLKKKRVSVMLDEDQLAAWKEAGGAAWLKILLTNRATDGAFE